jgi:hypothetical protein
MASQLPASLPIDSREAVTVEYIARADVAEWQTRLVEGQVGVIPWKFDSSHPHHIWQKTTLSRDGLFLLWRLWTAPPRNPFPEERDRCFTSSVELALVRQPR